MTHQILLRETALSIDETYSFLQDPEAGGICLFVGTIRNKNQQKDVAHLTMEAYSAMAKKQMERIADEAAVQWPIRKISVSHRTGKLEIGDIAVIIGVCSVHRAEAFKACEWLIDTLKQEVPIWKNEFYADGSAWLVPHP
ncbi:MAG: Molybdopterin synthase [Bacteroidota bacterium]|jgi:molybdopterin synthase catalytic subunit